MQISGTYLLNRQKTSLAFQNINPEYFNSLELAFRQPLLRGFGIDYNRSVINIAKKSIAGFRVREEMPLGTKVTLRGDKATPYANIVDVLDVCKGNGIQEPYLDTVIER